MPYFRPFLILLVLAAASLPAADPAQLRGVADKVGPALIQVRIVTAIAITMMGQNRNVDQETDVTGLFVDTSGLVVVPANELDPTAIISAMFGGNPMIKFESQLKEASFRLADGSEVPAELVLKDQELGLALLRPKTPGATFPAAVPFAGAKLKLADWVVLLGCAPRHAANALLVSEARIAGTVGGPQPYALVGGTGTAVCDEDGRLVGVLTAKDAPRKEVNKAEGMDPFSGLTASLNAKNLVPVPIIRPADAVLKLIEQAKKAK